MFKKIVNPFSFIAATTALTAGWLLANSIDPVFSQQAPAAPTAAVSVTPPVVVIPYPPGTTAIVASTQGTTASTIATLAGTAGKTTFICGFEVDAAASSGGANTMTITGLVGGITMNLFQAIGTSPTVARTITNFTPCLPANATNTPIAVTSAAAGAGGNTFTNAWGYQQ